MTFYIFEKWCKCSFKINKQKNIGKKNILSCHLECHWRSVVRVADPDPDPYQYGMSWIRNTAWNLSVSLEPLWSMRHFYFVRVADPDPYQYGMSWIRNTAWTLSASSEQLWSTMRHFLFSPVLGHRAQVPHHSRGPHLQRHCCLYW